MTLIGLPLHERLMADRCEHGKPWDVDCPKCYGLYEAEEGTRQ